VVRARESGLVLAIGTAIAACGVGEGDGSGGTTQASATTTAGASAESTSPDDGARADAASGSGGTATSSPPGTTAVATDDGSTSTATSTASDTTGGEPSCTGFDPNGTAQLYCTAEGKALPWTLGFDDWEDRIRQFGEITGEGSLTVAEASGQVRMTVLSVPGECEGITDHGQALEQGFMCTADDWLNWEMTGYFQLVTAAAESTDQDWVMYGNGGRHTGDGTMQGCLGSSYKGSYHYVDAATRLSKESWHVNYDQTEWKDVAGGIDYSAAKDAWLGMKVVRYRFERDGEAGVRLEVWLDLGGIDPAGVPANDWELVDVREDHPSTPWGSEATYCGAPVDDQIMFWGGPWVTWRWDGTASRVRLMSVREIVPPRA
jgi:hypothetical protein